MNNIPLLLLPGVLNDRRLWQHQAAEFGATILPTTGHDSAAGVAREALAAMSVPRFALAGFSLGGYVALEIMRQAPERVLGLALVDTNARPDSAQAAEARRAAMAKSATDFEGVLKEFVARLVHPTRLNDPDVMDLLVDMGHSVGREAYLRQQMVAMTRIDSRPYLREIRCPSLVLCGREDRLSTLEMHEEMAAGIGGAVLTVIDECGHAAPLERPGAVNAAMRAWMGRISG